MEVTVQCGAGELQANCHGSGAELTVQPAVKTTSIELQAALSMCCHQQHDGPCQDMRQGNTTPAVSSLPRLRALKSTVGLCRCRWATRSRWVSRLLQRLLFRRLERGATLALAFYHSQDSAVRDISKYESLEDRTANEGLPPGIVDLDSMKQNITKQVLQYIRRGLQPTSCIAVSSSMLTASRVFLCYNCKASSFGAGDHAA